MKQVSSLEVGKGFKNTEIGEIPVEWEVVSIKEIGNVVTGCTPPTKNYEFYNGQYLFITPFDIIDTKYVETTNKRLTKQGFNVSRPIPRNSILVTCIASIGKIAMSSILCCTNQQINSIICKENVDPHFIYYMLAYRIGSIKLLAGQTAIPIIKKSLFTNVRISFPSFGEQKRIGEILSAVDEAFEKLSEVIEKTRLMKKGMMRRLLTQGIGHTRFKKTEIGKIPATWGYKDLSSLSTRITKGTTPTTYGHSYLENGVLFLRIENINENGSFNLLNAKHISIETNDFLTRSKLQSGDILISIAGAIGRIAMVTNDILPANINQALALVRINERYVDKKYLFYALQGKAIEKQIGFLSSQLAQANLSLAQVGSLKIPIPTIEEQMQIISTLSLIDAELDQSLQYQAKLSELKKVLMRVLLTGKVRVKV